MNGSSWLLERDKSGKHLVELVSLPGKGRGLVCKSDLASNVAVLMEDCSFLRIASTMCVKCLASGHTITDCPEEKERIAPLLKQFAGCEGLLSQFFIPRSVLAGILSTLTEGGTDIPKKNENLARLYVAAPAIYRERISEEEFMKLYHVCGNRCLSFVSVIFCFSFCLCVSWSLTGGRFVKGMLIRLAR